jgi:hypothetical protein
MVTVDRRPFRLGNLTLPRVFGKTEMWHFWHPPANFAALILNTPILRPKKSWSTIPVILRRAFV